MKKRNLVLSVMATCLVSCFLLSGCNGQKQIDSETVKTVKVEEQAIYKMTQSLPPVRLLLIIVS